MVYLQSIKNYCERFWFTSNVVKLRIALMDYFRQEGIKCKLEDGHVNFDYGDYEFNTKFMVFEDYAVYLNIVLFRVIIFISNCFGIGKSWRCWSLFMSERR